MSKKDEDYKVYRRFLEDVEFEMLVLKIPDSEIEDKLTQLINEKGQISVSLFEDFLISICVANVSQLLFHLNQRIQSPEELINVRKEIMKHIFEANPLLNPDNLTINRNFVIKIKKDKLGKDERMLTDSGDWSKSYYESLIEEQNKFNTLLDKNDNKPKDKNRFASSKSKVTDDLEHATTKKWWSRLNKYIDIKVFSKSDMANILKQRLFHNKISFETYIVSVCVIGFRELFDLLDEMGIPQRISPPKLINELYELCKNCNPFLTYEAAQELVPDEDTSGDCQTPRQDSMASNLKRLMKKKKAKLFKDVPKEDILRIADNMKIFLIGQDDVVDDISEAIQRASVGLKDPEKPIGSFLFAGRTGCGKTYTSKVLADELIKGSKNNIVNIDCSEYSADHEYSKLIGAPSGYIGHEHGGILTNVIAKNPFSVVVFDEVEKASSKVHQLMLQILEEGRLTDGKGNVVSFKDAIIVMTSNIGVKEIESIKKTIGFGDVNKLTEEKKNVALKDALKSKFPPEFLNRIDSIVYFKTLSKKDYLRIIDIELNKLNDNLEANKSEYSSMKLLFDNKIKNYIYDKGINEEFGARPLKRCIEKEISTPLAKKLIRDTIDKDAVILITYAKSKVEFEEKEKILSPPFYISDAYSIDNNKLDASA